MRRKKSTQGLLPLLSACTLLAGCPPPPPMDMFDEDEGPRSYVFELNYRSSVGDLNARIGIWMHSEQRFDRSAIADWLGVPYAGKELLEPINVLWVDSLSGSEEEARDSVVRFLDDCGFEREGNVFFGLVPKHSSGYYAYGNGMWKPQYDPDDAWVQGFLGGEFPNNHGRVFPAFDVVASAGQVVYLTSGAFSREGGYGNPFIIGLDCLFNRENCHPYLSFDLARDALNCGSRRWGVSGPVDFGSSYPTSSAQSFSTGDHTGVLIFERFG